MKMNRLSLSALLILALTLCSLSPALAQDGIEVPEWMVVDNDAKTVNLDVIAGQNDSNNNWNYNGFAKGEIAIVIPEGYTVNLTFTNKDPNMAHSVAVMDQMDTYPPMFDSPSPAFEGAISSNATDMMTATKNGESEKLTFVVDKAGEYTLVCLIPAHAMTGMWIGFKVSADGNVGIVKGAA